MRNINFQKIESEIQELDFFKKIEFIGVIRHHLYHLKNTKYIFVFIKDEKKRKPEYLSLGWIQPEDENSKNFESHKFGIYKFTDISFEEVFESISDDIREKLLFHLDLFKY